MELTHEQELEIFKKVCNNLDLEKLHPFLLAKTGLIMADSNADKSEFSIEFTHNKTTRYKIEAKFELFEL